MSLRWRLTLYYGALSALMVLLAALSFDLSLRANLRGVLDGGLRDAARLAANQLGGDERRPALAGLDAPSFSSRLPAATTLLLYDRAGRLLDRQGQLRAGGPLRPGYDEAGQLRSYTLRTPDGAWVRAVRSEAELNANLGGARRGLAFIVPTLLLLGFGAGHALADRALRPVDAVSALAARIASDGQTGARVPLAPGEDEMARLTRTVNAMLERLDSTIRRERMFALAAAHELRTPLAVVQARTSLSLERDRSPEAYRSALRTVDDKVRDLTRLTEALLALAGSASVVPALLDLADLGAEVDQALAVQARAAGVALTLDLQRAPAAGDPALLRLAIANLVANALRHGYGGGRVWLRTGRAAHGAQVEVSDAGPGLSESELARVRLPFQRGPDRQGVRGAGLGLALVEAVVGGHGGRLTLSRAPEGGLRAALWLPAPDRAP